MIQEQVNTAGDPIDPWGFDSPLTPKQLLVLEAAVEVFADKGFERGSTQEIAKRAGVSEGLIFKRFSTKKDLLLAVGIFIASRISLPAQAREVTTLLAADYPRVEDLFRALITNRLEFARKHRRMIRVLIQELPLHPELQALARKLLGNTLIPAATAAIDRYKAKGQVRDLPSELILRVVLGQVLSYILLRHILLPKREWNDAQEIDGILKTLMSGIAA